MLSIIAHSVANQYSAALTALPDESVEITRKTIAEQLDKDPTWYAQVSKTTMSAVGFLIAWGLA